MKICKKCGAQLSDTTFKCTNCGAPAPAPLPIPERSHLSMTMGEEKPMKKRFKITIEEEVVEETLTSAAWTIVDQRDGDSKYGNPKQIPQTETVTRTIFTQNTAELNLIDVIKAVNGIGEP